MEMKNKKNITNEKYTYLTKLTVRYVKELKLYKQLICNLNLYNIQLTKLNLYKTIPSLYRFLTKYTNIKTNENHEKILNDFENYIYEKTLNKTKLQIFKQFLNQNNIRKKYYDNIKKHNKPYSQNMNGYYSRLGMLINDAFDWSSSNEGFEYWCKIHNKLLDYENKILTNIN